MNTQAVSVWRCVNAFLICLGDGATMLKPHPALLTFGQTCTQDFPLIMIVGREPNSPEGVVYGHGGYDFASRKKRQCGFWSISYGIAAATVGLSTAAFKELCVNRDASPLVYTDALPITILNEVKDKRPFRLAVSDEAVREHIEHVFSHEHIVSRVRLVIISGLRDPSFARSVAWYRAACDVRGLPVVEVPFFFGNNAPTIRAKLGPDNTRRIQGVMEQFKQANVMELSV